MANYRGQGSYRSGRIYRHGWMPGKPYRAGVPYRKPSTYRGTDSAVPVVSVGFGGGAGLAWSRPEVTSAALDAGWESVTARGAPVEAPLRDGLMASGAMVTAPLDQLDAYSVAGALLWRDFAAAAGLVAVLPSIQQEAHADGRALGWGDYEEHLRQLSEVPWSVSGAHSVGAQIPWQTYARQATAASVVWASLVERGAFVAMPWSPIAARSSRTVVDWVVDPNDGTDPITVPIYPVYIMIPTLSVVRLPDRMPLPVLSVSLQAELGTWHWSFTAPMARAGLALIDDGTGSPTEIEVVVNGHVWTFLVDGYDDNRRFGSSTCTLRGRSRSAFLAEPHAAVTSAVEGQTRTASQLAEQELAGSGWTLLWDAPDWLVPGGTFSYQDLAPIDAIAAVANSIGASILSHEADKQLRVAPTYPHSPWEWDGATPHAIVPAAILTEGSSSWVGGVNANGVYVYAQNSASGALVKISGSDGASQLPMVVDPLTVHADAQRERGRAELAASGIKRRLQRTVPLFPRPVGGDDIALGAVPLGALIEFQEDEVWRGQVMGVRIDAQRSGRAMSVRQHLTIERQYR